MSREVVKEHRGLPVGTMRRNVEVVTFSFVPIADNKDLRFAGLCGRTYADPESLRQRVRDCCGESNG